MYKIIISRLEQLTGLIVIAAIVTTELQGCVGSDLNLLLYAQSYSPKNLC